jgi:2,3-bisphosphoglycerate-dependent phosphoglycerate mutase
MRFISLIAFGMLLIISQSCSYERSKTTVYLVRHAEKDTTDKSKNPPLTQEGIQRAERLKNLLKHEDFVEIYSTIYDRNINTIKPLAELNELTPIIYEWHDWEREISRILNSEGVFLICGHGDNLLPMIEAMHGTAPIQQIGAYQYDYLFKLKIYRKRTEVEVMRF